MKPVRKLLLGEDAASHLPVAQQLLASLNAQGAPILAARRDIGADTTIYVQKGLIADKIIIQTGDDGYATIKEIAGESYAWGARHVPGGNFHPRGKLFQGPVGSVYGAAFLTMGKGYAMTLATEGADWVMYRSPDLGRSAQAVLSQPTSYPSMPSSAAALYGALGYYRNPSNSVKAMPYLGRMIQLDGGGGWDVPIMFYSLDTGKVWEFSLLPANPNADHVVSPVFMLAPGVLWSLIFSGNTPHGPATAADPLFVVSDDYGLTWSSTSAYAALGNFLAKNSGGWNTAAGLAGSSMGFATIGEEDHVVFIFATNSANVIELRTYRLAASGLAMTQTGTLPIAPLSYFTYTGPLGGGRIFAAAYSQGGSGVKFLRSDDAGANWTDFGAALPTATTRYLGLPTPLRPYKDTNDQGVIVIPSWDGIYSYYVSKDSGETWERSGTIDDDEIAPGAGPIPSMRNHSQIAWVGTPASPAPIDPLYPGRVAPLPPV